MLPEVINGKALSELLGVPLTSNLQSLADGLAFAGSKAGLTAVHHLVPFLAQVAHESMGLRYDQEIWGPTPAQRRYDTRTDLGNTPAVDGDGYKHRGFGPIQLTGAANQKEFRDWCRANIDPKAPDFLANPELILTDPWEGVSAIWFWITRDLGRYAEVGDFAGLTKRINGGYNGYKDRMDWYVKIALKALGFSENNLHKFQKWADIPADGIVGPITLKALHRVLKEAPKVSFTETPAPFSSGPGTKLILLAGLVDLLASFFPFFKGNA